MKKKLALLMAAIMGFSLVPSMNVFAASSNTLTNTNLSVPKETYVVEESLITGTASNAPERQWYISKEDTHELGSSLKVRATTQWNKGTSFLIELTNAEWSFNTRSYTYNETTKSLPSWDVRYGDYDGSISTYTRAKLNSNQAVTAVGVGSEREIGYSMRILSGQRAMVSFDQFGTTDGDNMKVRITGAELNALIAWLGEGENHVPGGWTNPTNAGGGTYNGYPIVEEPGTELEGVRYYRIVPQADSRVFVNDYILIPLVILTDKADDVRIKIPEAGDTGVSVSSTGYLVSSKTDGGTNTWADDTITARDVFDLKRVYVQETRLRTIPTGNIAFQLRLPYGYEWSSPNEVVLRDENDGNKIINGKNVNSNGTVTTTDSTLTARIDSRRGDTLYILGEITTAASSNNIRRRLLIDNLRFYTTVDNLPLNDIKVEIRDVPSGSLASLGSSDPKRVFKGAEITTESFVVATRSDWTLRLQIDKDRGPAEDTGRIPDLWSGRYETTEPENIGDDEQNMAASVIFDESIPGAWGSGRETVFELPDGVKYRKVYVSDSNTALKDVTVLSNDSGGNNRTIRIDGNKLIIRNVDISDRNTATEIYMDIWVSIAADFDGPVKMSLKGSAVPTSEEKSIDIATATPPISISTGVTELKTGFQYQSTQNIVIKENGAGALIPDEEVYITVSDMVTSDLGLASDFKVAVTEPSLSEGAVEVDDVGMLRINSYRGALGAGSGTIKFKVTRQSEKASTITISNVSVMVDRTVPESNRRPFKVIVWGIGVAPNYEEFGDTVPDPEDRDWNTKKDRFDTPGISVDYARIVTPGGSVGSSDAGLTSDIVRFVQDQTTYTVGSTTLTAPVAPYISTATNSFLIPLRAVATALGVKEEQVVWDNTARTVTIITPTKTVQFFYIQPW